MLRLPRNCGPEARGKLAAEAAAVGLAVVVGAVEEERLQQQVGLGFSGIFKMSIRWRFRGKCRL